MRERLDARRVKPQLFTMTIAGSTTAFRLQSLTEEDDGAAIARSFRRRIGEEPFLDTA